MPFQAMLTQTRLAPKPDHKRPYAEIQAQYAHVPVPVANPQYARQYPVQSSTPPAQGFRERSYSHGQGLAAGQQCPDTAPDPSVPVFVSRVESASTVQASIPPGPASVSPSAVVGPSNSESSRQFATAVSFERGVAVQSAPAQEEGYGEDDDSSDEREAPQHGHGTLMIDDQGRSFFLGSTAGSEWLREPEEDTMTPYPVGGRRAGFGNAGQMGMAPTTPQSLFPFPIANMDSLTAAEMMLKQLPERTEAKVLANCYFRHMAWQ